MAYFKRNGAGDYWPLYFGPTPLVDSDRNLSPDGRAALAFLRAHEASTYFWRCGSNGFQYALDGDTDAVRVFETKGNDKPPVENIAPAPLGFYSVENLDRGWISLEGRFYPVKYGCHQSFIENVLNKTIYDTQNWVQVQPDFWCMQAKSGPRGRPIVQPNPAQADTLEKIGRSLMDRQAPRDQSVVFAHAVPDWENRKPALRSNIVKIDTTIYDAQEISGKKKTEFFDGLRRMTNLHRDRRLWHAQHEDGEGDHVPAAGLIRIQQDEQAIRTALRL